jgi:acetyltransferase-like isoleucine patch superfamily enzyme
MDDRAGCADGDDGDDGEAAERRSARLTRMPTLGRRNSLWSWTDAKPPLRVALNYLLVWIARVVPSLRARNWALRRLGAAVGPGVAWGLEATPDVFWPELITLGGDCIVGYDATLLCHEFLQDEYRTGEVVVGERAMIGAGVVVLPGVEIGADARVAANSLVADDVPAGATVAGVPAEVVSTDGREEYDYVPDTESGDDADGTGDGLER